MIKGRMPVLLLQGEKAGMRASLLSLLTMDLRTVFKIRP
jgi:hypothetical protein